MGRSQDVLVGRDGERAVLERLVSATCAGVPRSLFLTGEPGIGKTHLLAELARRAERLGCLVLEGRAAEFEQELPFGVFIDALDAYVQSLEPRSVDRLAADGLEELAEVFPSLRSLRSTTWTPATAAERFRAYYAVRDLLERLTAKQPMVLILDDLHWADSASLELMAHLLRRPPDAPILLAGSFRTGQGAAGLLVAIDAADLSGEVERIELGPLGAGEASVLLAGRDVATRDRLYLQSGGNPVYLLQLARVSPNGPGLAREEGDQVPPAVAAAIAHELDSLSPPRAPSAKPRRWSATPSNLTSPWPPAA
ncbi:MAG: AAA family ATPase [Acidimicrobiales bacterium]